MNFLKRAWNATCKAVTGFVDDAKFAIATLTGGAIFGSSLLPADAHAAVDYTALTTAADFGGLGTALVGVIVVLIGASLLVAGGMAVWNLVKRGRSV